MDFSVAVLFTEVLLLSANLIMTVASNKLIGSLCTQRQKRLAFLSVILLFCSTALRFYNL